MIGRKILSAVAIIGLGFALSLSSANAQMNEAEKRAKDSRNKAFVVGEKKSGYVYMTSQTRDMQDDDFGNPAFVWVDTGEALWNKVDGTEGKSCATCHKSASKSMKGAANTFPRYDAKTKKMIAMQAYLNRHLGETMGAKPWKWESEKMLAMAIYIKLQSRGTPVKSIINNQNRATLAPFLAKGKKFFEQRRGLLDMSCKHCHEDNPGNMARSNVLSMAMPNGFPTYRLKWQKPGSIHRRFSGCNKNVRAKPYKRGSEEYTNLEFYLMQRSAGLKWETPAVRN
jgi:L-cysteine S-thiosulfotransferase